MPRTLSPALIARLKLDGLNAPRLLIAIAHPNITTLRYVVDNEPFVLGSTNYAAANAKVTLPDSGDSPPSASIAVTNATREGMALLELNYRNATVTLSILDRDNDVVVWTTTLFIDNVTATDAILEIKASYDKILSAPAVRLFFDKATFPGIFK